MKGRVMSIAALIVLLVVIVYAAQNQGSIQNTGIIRGIGVEISVSSISWGDVEPGNLYVSPIIYVKNVGNKAMSIIFNCTNFVPVEAAQYLNTTWDYGGQQIGIGLQMAVKFSLNVSRATTMIGNFSYLITVYGV